MRNLHRAFIKGKNNLMWCRTIDGNKAAGRTDILNPIAECPNQICLPCGRREGGCSKDPEPNVEGVMPVHAGYHIQHCQWNKEKNRAICVSANLRNGFIKTLTKKGTNKLKTKRREKKAENNGTNCGSNNSSTYSSKGSKNKGAKTKTKDGKT